MRRSTTKPVASRFWLF